MQFYAMRWSHCHFTNGILQIYTIYAGSEMTSKYSNTVITDIRINYILLIITRHTTSAREKKNHTRDTIELMQINRCWPLATWRIKLGKRLIQDRDTWSHFHCNQVKLFILSRKVATLIYFAYFWKEKWFIEQHLPNQTMVRLSFKYVGIQCEYFIERWKKCKHIRFLMQQLVLLQIIVLIQ